MTALWTKTDNVGLQPVYGPIPVDC